MDEKKNNGRGIFYGVIGVATLVVAIVGATFAYFTATMSNNNVITGNMATIQFGLNVIKVTHVDETKGGMIPMSNSMVEAAVSDSTTTYADSSKGAGTTCVDDNGNAVCQIYRIRVTNTGTASLFLDGYVSLVNGSGVATDTGPNGLNLTNLKNNTTMRWAQVFCTGTQEDEITGCTTIGRTTTGATLAVGGETQTSSGITADWDTIAAPDKTVDEVTTTYSHNLTNIKTTYNDVVVKGAISGNNYDIINRNYIRISDHDASATGYKRATDITSALVFNQYLDAASDAKTTDETVYYFVVWLSETGTNQTVGATGAATSALNFFQGFVSFNSAQGSEVTATFSSYTAVTSDQA